MRQPGTIELIVRPLAWVVLVLLLGPLSVCAQDEATPASEQKGLQQRIDFGNAHILGQNIKSGAVYLMHRKKSDIKSMLEVRENYRKEIIEDYSLERTAITGNAVQGAGDPPK
jgi:hypothetical protein